MSRLYGSLPEELGAPQQDSCAFLAASFLLPMLPLREAQRSQQGLLSPGVIRSSTGVLSGSGASETPTGPGSASYSLARVWGAQVHKARALSQGNVEQTVHVHR